MEKEFEMIWKDFVKPRDEWKKQYEEDKTLGCFYQIDLKDNQNGNRIF